MWTYDFQVRYVLWWGKIWSWTRFGGYKWKYLLFPLAIATITNTNSEDKNIFNVDIICLICKLLYVCMYFLSYWETTDTISEPTYQYLYPRILPHSGRYPHLSFQIGILPWIPLDLWRFLRHRNGLEVHRSI